MLGLEDGALLQAPTGEEHRDQLSAEWIGEGPEGADLGGDELARARGREARGGRCRNGWGLGQLLKRAGIGDSARERPGGGIDADAGHGGLVSGLPLRVAGEELAEQDRGEPRRNRREQDQQGVAPVARMKGRGRGVGGLLVAGEIAPSRTAIR